MREAPDTYMGEIIMTPGKNIETLPILVVNDDPISSDILRKYLEEEGYTSISVTNGQDTPLLAAG